jgi:hypothetical protein
MKDDFSWSGDWNLSPEPLDENLKKIIDEIYLKEAII